MTTDQKIQLAIALATATATLVYLFTFLNLASANRRLGASIRLSTLAQMVDEMNELRRFRAEHPDLERVLFESRRGWDNHRIQRNLVAVQLANILEWAYIARRNDLIDKDVWESWATTWREVIAASDPLRESFEHTVWTFGREKTVLPNLQDLIFTQNPIPDPRRGLLQS